MTMKKSLALAILILPLFSGCSSLQKNPLAYQRLADHVAYDVSSAILDRHPDWRPDLQKAATDIAVVEIIERLPVDELQSPTARIGIDGAFFLIELSGNPALKPTDQESLRTIVRGLRMGLQRRLIEPDALHRLRSARPALPPVPKR
jgi:hypothetical protein